ncbi:hypothetical protein [Capnocytophaga cynodegmi]|nr:hypothetical protein [Capnocytophaga cynodegmi]
MFASAIVLLRDSKSNILLPDEPPPELSPLLLSGAVPKTKSASCE